jgi:hypothetical protein
MSRTPLAPAILALMLAGSSQAASLTPPNLTAATTLNNADLLLVWPNASNGPLEAMQWSIFEGQIVAGVGSAFLQPSNNLSDVGNPTIARTNLGLGSASLVFIGTSGGALCLLNTACTWSAAQTLSAKLNTAASVSGGAGLNIAPGAAPSSPSNGDVWTTNSGLFAQIGGATQQYPAYSAASWTPTLTPNIIGDWSFSYTAQKGGYTKLGSTCVIYFDVEGTPTYSTSSGALNINFPISPAGVSNQFIFGSLGTWKVASGPTAGLAIYNGGGTLNFTYGSTAGGLGGGTVLSVSNLSSGVSVKLAGGAEYPC